VTEEQPDWYPESFNWKGLVYVIIGIVLLVIAVIVLVSFLAA